MADQPQNFSKQTIKLPDGRELIYYRFPEQQSRPPPKLPPTPSRPPTKEN